MAKSKHEMSTQTAESASRAGAEKKSSTGVIEQEAPKTVDLKKLREEHEAAKKDQRSRVEDQDRAALVELYRLMLLIRRFEEKSAEAYSMGKIGGFCHLYIGQEAVAVGAISAVRTDDYVLTSYREHAHAIAKGISPEAVMATPAGTVEVGLEVKASSIEGTVDWHITFPDGSVASAYSRVLPISAGQSAYSFVLMAPPVPLEQLEGTLDQQVHILRDELAKLKAILSA